MTQPAKEVSVNPSLVLQHLLADASIVFAILTTALVGIHLPPLASAVLGVFGVLLHPQTSIIPASTTVTTIATPPGTSPQPATITHA